MKRSIGILLGLVTIVVVFGSVAAYVFAHFDWNRAKSWLASRATQAIGRDVAIDGDLRVRWQRDPELTGWRSWIPGANISAYKVTVGNTPWAEKPVFATADRVEFDLSLLPLLAHTVSVPAVRFVAPNVHFERLAGGSNNWTFDADSTSLPWLLDVGSVKFDDGELSVIDRVNALDVRMHVHALQKSIPFDELVAQQEELSQREAATRIGAGAAGKFGERARKRDESLQRSRGDLQQYAFGFTVEGSLRGNAVNGAGGVASVLALKQNRPFPLHADVRVGDTRIAFVGTLTDPTDLEALDLRLWLSGKSLAHLYDIFRVTMPESPPYATEGHLTGRFKAHDKNLRYENFTARVGESDLLGNLKYETKLPRPLLSGNVQSERLQFRDLAPMIGVRPSATDAATGKVLPAAPFRPERWQAMDADVKFTGDHVFRDSELPIHNVDTHIVMDNAVLSLKPLHFRFAYGDVESTLQFDGRSVPVKGTFDLAAHDVQLKHVFKTAEASNVDLGTARGTAHLSASGDSIGSLLGAANGELKAALDDGTLSKALIETAGLNILNIVLAKLLGDKPVKIDCAAADLVATDGVFDARMFEIDTDIARFSVTGNVDLADEKLDLVVRTSTKSLRLLSLRSPIHVTGPISHPDAGIDKGVLLARSAGAVGLALIAAPLAAAVPLTDAGFGRGDGRCAPLLEEIRQQAPASGKAR